MTFTGNLTDSLVPGTDEIFYIPEFVTADEESYLIRKINDSPLPKWKQLANRRLQIWGGTMTTKGALIPEQLPQFVTKYPDIVGRIRATGAFTSSLHGAPNHIIMNEYRPGQGIMPHEDGPAYHPTVATLSLGSHAVFHYYGYKADDSASPGSENAKGAGEARIIDSTPVCSVLLEPRSLIITRSRMYTEYLHGIDDVTDDVFSDAGRMANTAVVVDQPMKTIVENGGVLRRQTRYSLTCRDVAKVITIGGFSRFFNGQPPSATHYSAASYCSTNAPFLPRGARAIARFRMLSVTHTSQPLTSPAVAHSGGSLPQANRASASITFCGPRFDAPRARVLTHFGTLFALPFTECLPQHVAGMRRPSGRFQIHLGLSAIAAS